MRVFIHTTRREDFDFENGNSAFKFLEKIKLGLLVGIERDVRRVDTGADNNGFCVRRRQLGLDISGNLKEIVSVAGVGVINKFNCGITEFKSSVYRLEPSK